MITEQLSEILQICIILFLVSMFISFCTANIFDLIDNEIERIHDVNSKNTAIIFITFIQLFVCAVMYFFIDLGLHHIRPWREIIKSFRGHKSYKITLGELNTADYGVHIFLIIMLIEMNGSLKKNLHSMSEIITITKKNKIEETLIPGH